MIYVPRINLPKPTKHGFYVGQLVEQTDPRSFYQGCRGVIVDLLVEQGAYIAVQFHNTKVMAMRVCHLRPIEDPK